MAAPAGDGRVFFGCGRQQHTRQEQLSSTAKAQNRLCAHIALLQNKLAYISGMKVMSVTDMVASKVAWALQ